MNYHSSIISSMLDIVDQYSANFVANTYQHIVNEYSSVAYTFATMYLGLIFIDMKKVGRRLQELPYILLKIVFILTLALNYQYFYLYVYNIFTNAPMALCKALTLSNGQVNAVSINGALDGFLKQGVNEASQLFSKGGWSNWVFIVFGIGVFLATVIATTFALGLFFMAKIASAILLALSPLFIFFALFDSTKGWFDSYIQHLLGYALIPVMTSAIMMITLSVTNTTIEYMNSDTSSVALLLPFIIACLVQVWLFAQITQKCAALSSGFNLKSFSAPFQGIKGRIQSLTSSYRGTSRIPSSILNYRLRQTSRQSNP